MNSSTHFLDLARPWLTQKTVAWPVLPSSFLHKEQAFSLKAFDLPILLIRSAEGNLSAHLDRCPHRHVSFFSAGQPPAVQGGTVTCPYHLQSFDQSGQCIRSIHDSHPPNEHLVNLTVFEASGFIWMPVNRALFKGDRPRQFTEAEIEDLKQSLILPKEFDQGLNDPKRFDCRDLFSYLYPLGPWQIVITSAIDHTHGFQVHQIARVVHRLRRWLGQETLSGMHMVCDDHEKSVLVTYQQYADSLDAYWKVGCAPNLWLNKLGNELYIAVIFVPETAQSTRMYGSLYIGKEWCFLLENHPMMTKLRELSITNSTEDQPFIESQTHYLKPGQLPIGNASVNDSPVYHFFKYFEEITGERVDFHHKPKVSDLFPLNNDP